MDGRHVSDPLRDQGYDCFYRGRSSEPCWGPLEPDDETTFGEDYIVHYGCQGHSLISLGGAYMRRFAIMTITGVKHR